MLKTHYGGVCKVIIHYTIITLVVIARCQYTDEMIRK